jgi:hypothetical protein
MTNKCFVILSAAKNLLIQNQNLEALVMSWILADFLVNLSSTVFPPSVRTLLQCNLVFYLIAIPFQYDIPG